MASSIINIGETPRPELVTKYKRFRPAAVVAVYLSNNGLGSLSFDAASQGSVNAGLSTGINV